MEMTKQVPKLEQEREKEPGGYFTTFMMTGNCSGLQCSETKKKETNKQTKKVLEIFSINTYRV